MLIGCGVFTLNPSLPIDAYKPNSSSSIIYRITELISGNIMSYSEYYSSGPLVRKWVVRSSVLVFLKS